MCFKRIYSLSYLRLFENVGVVVRCLFFHIYVMSYGITGTHVGTPGKTSPEKAIFD